MASLMSVCFSGSLPAYSCIHLLWSLFVLCLYDDDDDDLDIEPMTLRTLNGLHTKTNFLGHASKVENITDRQTPRQTDICEATLAGGKTLTHDGWLLHMYLDSISWKSMNSNRFNSFQVFQSLKAIYLTFWFTRGCALGRN